MKIAFLCASRSIIMEITQEPVEEKKSIPELALKVGHGKRLANFFVDKIASLILAVVIVLSIMPTSYFESDNRIMDYLLEAGALLAYYLIVEVPSARSLGKLITKTIVVDGDGNKASTSQLITRSFCRIVPFEHFSFLGNDASGWHDKWSDTHLILMEDYQKQSNSDALDSIFLEGDAAK